jgi:hypothetical protein
MTKASWIYAPWLTTGDGEHRSLRSLRRQAKRLLAKGEKNPRIERSVPPFTEGNPTAARGLK